MGDQVFLFIWAILPFLYSAYILLLWILAPKAPGVLVQRTLCAFGIFHFLFLTDCVDYRFGRGLHTPHAEWAHWSERLVWRIGVCLPLYQNIASGHWKNGHPIKFVGQLFHYVVGLWAVAYTVCEMLSLPFRFFRFVKGLPSKYSIFMTLGYGGVFPNILTSYLAAAVVLWLVYGIALGAGFENYGIFVHSEAIKRPDSKIHHQL
jgi:hypothetical protein